MKPKIEDYSPYYIGGQIHTGKTGLATNLGLFYSYTPGELGEISPAPTGLTLFFKELGQRVDPLAVVEFDSEDYQDCKLAVRPFSKLTPEEALSALVSIIKAGVTLVGHGAGPVRAPLTDLKKDEVQALKKLIDSLGPQ